MLQLRGSSVLEDELQARSGSGGVDPLAPHSLSPSELKTLLSTERRDCPFLALRDGHGELRLKVLDRDSVRLTIGRRSDADLAVPWDAEVSGLHAELQCLAGEWTVVDDGLSRNGTFLNGHRIRSRRRLRPGDRIRVGQTIVAFAARADAQAGTTVAAREPGVLPELSPMQRRVLIALCRPLRDGDAFATPATNQQIAADLFLSVDAVKTHLRVLFGKFGLADLPQNQKRARLAERALELGFASGHEL